MTFAREGERVILDMESTDYDELMVLFGDLLATSAVKNNPVLLYRGLQFLNAMNRTNDEYKPYEIPDEFREPR